MEFEIVYPAGVIGQKITDQIIRQGKRYHLLSACRSPGFGLSVVYVAAEELDRRLATGFERSWLNGA